MTIAGNSVCLWLRRWVRGILLLATVSPVLGTVDLEKIGMTAPLDPALAPALLPATEVPGLPRVLLIGDSISIAYTREVRQRLAGRANVQRPPVNCGPTVLGLEQLETWLGSGRWDVIHFNFGLHDLKYLDANGTYIVPGPRDRPLASPEHYAANLRVIVTRLKQTGARLVFASTTPVPAGVLGRLAGSEQAYNAAALKVMQAAGVAVDDLHSVALAHLELQLPHNVHFTRSGCEVLADQVAASISAQLKP